MSVRIPTFAQAIFVTCAAVSVVATATGQCTGGAAGNTDSPCFPMVVPGAPGVYEYLMDVSLASPDFPAACGSNLGHTVWFSITPSEDLRITFSTCHPETAYDTVVQVWTNDNGDCEFPVRQDALCNDDWFDAACNTACSGGVPRNSQVTFDAVIGTTYLIQVGSYNENNAGCDLCLGVRIDSAPLNDDCTTPLAIGGTGVFSFNNAAATTDGLTHASCTPIGRDLWYRWTPPADGAYRLSTCGLTAVDTNVAVYFDPSLTCPPGDQLLYVCNDDFCGLQSSVEFHAFGGFSYYLRIGSYQGAAGGPGSFLIESIPPICTQPAENCQPIEPGSATVSDTTFHCADDFRLGSAAGALNQVCWYGHPDGLDANAPHSFEIRYYADDGANGPGVPGTVLGEYKESDGTLSVQVQTVPQLFEYMGTHADLALAPDRCYWISIVETSGAQSWLWKHASEGVGRSVIDLTPGDGWADASDGLGDFGWCFNIPVETAAECALAPDHDHCLLAQAIAGYGTFPFDNTYATTNGPAADADCSGPMSGDLWYRWTAPDDGSVTIGTVGQTTIDTVLEVYDGSLPCPGTLPPDEVHVLACDDDVTPGVYQSEVVLVVEAGADYLIRLGNYILAPSGTGDFYIFPTNINTEPPDHCQVPNQSNTFEHSDPHFVTADDFRLLAPGSVDTVCWWGLFFNTFTLEPHDFEIRYFTDDGDHGPGVPGSLIAAFSEGADTLTVTRAIGADGEIEFCGMHAPLPLPAETRLWISVREQLSASTLHWGWHQADGNDRLVYRDDLEGWSEALPRAADVAFCLNLPLADLAACPADTDANGTVNIEDLLTLLAAWGVCSAPCLPDVDDDGDVDISDLLALLAAWGTCP